METDRDVSLSGTFPFEGIPYEFHAVKGPNGAPPTDIDIYRTGESSDREWVGHVSFSPTREVKTARPDDRALLDRMSVELETARLKFRARRKAGRPLH